jgi:hypothetical protein
MQRFAPIDRTCPWIIWKAEWGIVGDQNREVFPFTPWMISRRRTMKAITELRRLGGAQGTLLSRMRLALC